MPDFPGTTVMKAIKSKWLKATADAPLPKGLGVLVLCSLCLLNNIGADVAKLAKQTPEQADAAPAPSAQPKPMNPPPVGKLLALKFEVSNQTTSNAVLYLR